MKLICTKDNLLLALSLISNIASKNLNLPILNNVLIKATSQKVELIATNLELGVTAQLRAKVEEEGSFTVPARTLYDFVNLLSEEKVEIQTKENELEVNCGKSATKIKGAPAEEFPVLPTISDGIGYLVNVDDLKKGLEQVIYAAARNDIRPELAGVSFGFNDSKKGFLTIAATDSYRLAEKKIKIIQGEEEKKIIVPARTAQEINRVLTVTKNIEAEKNIRIVLADNQIVLRYNDVEMTSRLVEGQYPDYTQIIPKEFKTIAEFSTTITTKEVKAASLFTTSGVNAITFDFKTDQGLIGISSVSAQTGEYKSDIEVEIKGEKNTILLNHRYILDGLNNIETEVGLIKVVNPDSPCVFVPKDDDSFTYIIMPIRQ